jgi:hypothetical protein
MERIVNMKRLDSWVLRSRHLVLVLAISWSALALRMCEPAFAQKGFAGCLPVGERKSEVGCWILASESVGQLPQRPVFWHLDKFSTSALAEKANEPRGTVLRALGKVWLLTIAEAGWRPKSGEHIAEIGPLPVNSDTKYVAQYIEAVMNPGMETRLYRHPGPEAWYTEGKNLFRDAGRQAGRPKRS